VPESYEAFLTALTEACKVNPEPLQVKEIPAELIWKRFKSGGFDSLMVYRNALFLQLALGIKYFDGEAEKNISYEYEITKKVKQTETVTLTKPISYPTKPINYNGNLTIEQETILGVRMEYICKTSAPALIRVYREENYSGKFLPIRAGRIKTISNDTIRFAIQDSVVNPNGVYRYYVLPLDYYGNYGVISDTVTAIASSKQYAGNIERMDVVSYGNEGTAIRWKLSNPQNFNYVAIYRTSNYDSSLVKIGMISAADSQYIDATAEPMQMYFYAIQPLTASGAKIPMSAKVTGMFTPKNQPLAPYINEVIASEKGFQIQIKNNDNQSRGFRIYRKQDNDSTYTLISDLIKADASVISYFDSLNLAPAKYYTYMVKAENKAYVLSPASNIIRIKSAIPSTMLPISIPEVTIVNNVILISWKNNISNNDIRSYSVFRKEKNGKETCLAEFISPQDLTYTDTTASKEIEYTYGIAYRDGNSKLSAIAYAPAVSIQQPKNTGPNNVYAASNENNLIISWSDKSSNITAYKIYNMVADKPVLLGEVNAGNNTYTVKNVQSGTAYSIYITSIDSNKQESAPGKLIHAYID
jgi:fibronectin type 3 domain-containing protein